MKTKEVKKLYNLRLPQSLIDYLNCQSNEKFTSIGQYIVDLIMKDKETKENPINLKILNRMATMTMSEQICDQKLPKDYTVKEKKEMFIFNSLYHFELNNPKSGDDLLTLSEYSKDIVEMLELYDFEKNCVAATPSIIDNYNRPVCTMSRKCSPKEFVELIKNNPQYDYYLYSFDYKIIDSEDTPERIVMPIVRYAQKTRPEIL